MPSEYTIYVYNSSNVLQAIVTDFNSFNIARITNGYDTMELTVPYNSPYRQYLGLEAYIVVYRSNTKLGINSYIEFQGVIQLTQLQYGQLKRWRIIAFGWECLLARRIIAYNEDKPNHTGWQNVYASTIMNDMVQGNIGSESTTVDKNNRAVSGIVTNFTIDTTKDGLGNQLHVSDVSYENLLSALQDVALRGNCDFDVIWNVLDGGTGWTFRVGSPLLEGVTNRSSWIKFSVDNGTLADITITNDRTTYGTTAIVRSVGAQNATIRIVRPATAPTGLNSREFFVEASALGNATNDLNGAGDEKLLEYAKRVLSITTEVQQTPSNLYGKDYFIGDLVSVDILTGTEILQVNQVRINMSDRGVETIGVQLEYAN